MRPGTRRTRSQATPSAAASASSAVRVGIVAERRRIGDRNAGAGEIDGGVEGVAAIGEAVAAVVAARQFHHHFADRNDARGVVSSWLRVPFARAGPRRRHDGEQCAIWQTATWQIACVRQAEASQGCHARVTRHLRRNVAIHARARARMSGAFSAETGVHPASGAGWHFPEMLQNRQARGSKARLRGGRRPRGRRLVRSDRGGVLGGRLRRRAPRRADRSRARRHRVPSLRVGRALPPAGGVADGLRRPRRRRLGPRSDHRGARRAAAGDGERDRLHPHPARPRRRDPAGLGRARRPPAREP